MNKIKYPILWTFRRCPYAMRARFVLRSYCKTVEVREIKLKDKPIEFINISEKATVPVLMLSERNILDDSMKIVNWCLESSGNSKKIGMSFKSKGFEMIDLIDSNFKFNLDRYKYSNKFKNTDAILFRNKNIDYLKCIDKNLRDTKFLFSNDISFIDYSIFPFVRQFRNVDIDWFEKLNLKNLKNWFSLISNDHEFSNIMNKYPIWNPKNDKIITNFRNNEKVDLNE